MKKETKGNKAKKEILRILPYEEKRAIGSRRIIDKLDKLGLNIHWSYISNLLIEMGKEGTIYYKKVPAGRGFVFWNKPKKETKDDIIARSILRVLSRLNSNAAMSTREITCYVQDFNLKILINGVRISGVLGKMYSAQTVKRSKILYKDGYWYWLEGDEREKNIRGEPMQRKSVIKEEKNTDDRLKHAKELHNLNVSLRELIGKYRNNNKKLKQMIDSKDKEIERQKSRITTLELELQNISTEQDVAKDIYESRRVLEHTFK